MIRFVAISSIKRGAIEPAEVLSGLDQEMALDRFELDGQGVGEIVIWRGTEPHIAPRGYKPESFELKPPTSARLLEQIRGAEMEFGGERNERLRRRKGISKRF